VSAKTVTEVVAANARAKRTAGVRSRERGGRGMWTVSGRLREKTYSAPSLGELKRGFWNSPA